MKQGQTTLTKGDLRIKLRDRKSDYPGYLRVEAIFPDIFQSELYERHNWSETAVKNFDVHLFGILKGLSAVVKWEDREYFTIDIPAATTKQPLVEVCKLLEKLLTEGPFSEDKVNGLKQLSEEADAKASEASALETSKIREDITLFRGYKKNPSAKFGHEGFCIIEMHRVKSVKGLGYEEQEFLGQDRKLVTKPGMVLLNVSVDGAPFMQIYQKKIDYRAPYDSLLEAELLKIADSPSDVIKKSHSISTTTGDAEHVTFLCTEAFANRVKEFAEQKFPYLDFSP